MEEEKQLMPEEAEALHGRAGAKAFAQRLNAAKEKWAAEYRTQFFDQLGLRDPNTGELFADEAALRAAMTEALADRAALRAADAAQRAEIGDLQELIGILQDAQEAEALKNDPVMGSYFAQFGQEAQALVQQARENSTPLSLEAAFHAVLLQNLGEVLGTERQRAHENATQVWEANRRASPAALGGEAAEAVVDYGKMSDAEFNRVLRRALNGELRKQ